MTNIVKNLFKKLPFWRRYTTSQFKNWWVNRKIDWDKDYLSTWDHPHRSFIIAYLRSFEWTSLMEIGVGAGANLMKIIKTIKGKQLGGIDINPEAIAAANRAFNGGKFIVNSADDIMMSDKSTDVVLSDMCLIYVGPLKIDGYIREIKRITRGRVVLCEFHSTSLWKRLKLRLSSGYNAYDYKKLLAKHGFYDIQAYKIPAEMYPGAKDLENRYLIAGTTPRR